MVSPKPLELQAPVGSGCNGQHLKAAAPLTTLVLILRQRLHQPHRPLQPPQHLHRSRSCRPRIFDISLPHQRVLGRSDPESASVGMEWQKVREIPVVLICVVADRSRIFENQHLLDATEIFRKLNVHKKVRTCLYPSRKRPRGGSVLAPLSQHF